MAQPKSLPELHIITNGSSPIYIPAAIPDPITTVIVDTTENVYLHSIKFRSTYLNEEVILQVYDRDDLIFSSDISSVFNLQGQQPESNGILKVTDYAASHQDPVADFKHAGTLVLDLSANPVHFDELKIQVYSVIDEPFGVSYQAAYHAVEFQSGGH